MPELTASVSGGSASGNATLEVYRLLNLEQVRDVVKTDISDEMLQVYVDAAEGDILRFAGPHGTTVTHSKPLQATRSTYVLLPRRAKEILSVEIDDGAIEPDEYQVEHQGLAVRIWFNRPYSWSTASYARFNWQVSITYTAEDDRPQRRRALLQLVRLAVQEDGLANERVGDYSRTSVNYGKERRRILAPLRSPHARMA